MKISSRVEALFSQAVALDQAGRFKNSIHCKGTDLFIVNFDKTVMLRFDVPKPFDTTVNMFASDYDSPNFTEDDGRIFFVQREAGFVRTKSNRIPDLTFEEVREVWDRRRASDNSKADFFVLDRAILSLLDNDLSHIEIFSNGVLVIQQRDIYSGALIRVVRDTKGLGLAGLSDRITKNFGPLGIRTADFNGIFAFNSRITFYPHGSFLYFSGSENSMEGFVGTCLYDELGTIAYVREDEDGRKESEKRFGQQEVDRPAKEIKRRKIC